MDIGSILLGLALLVVIAFIVVRPLLEPPNVSDQPASPADQLLGRREQVLTQLRDLDFDSATGKFNAEDYAAQRAQLVAEGVDILKQLDALGPAAAAPLAVTAAIPAASQAMVPADEIEAAVAQRRARRAAAARPSRAPEPSRDLDAEIEASVAARRTPSVARSTAADRLAVAIQPAPAEKPAFAEKPAPAEWVAVPDKLGLPDKLVSADKLACAQCGTAVLLDDRFCPKCGSVLTIACSNCGRLARNGDKFCAHCGQSLPVTPLPASLPVRPAKVQS